MQSDRKKNPEIFSKAKKFCLRLLAVRQRSEQEIFDRLELKGFGRPVSLEIVDKLKAEGLLNDKKFAEDWVDARLRRSPRSKTSLETELRAKGISVETIEEVFDARKEELEDKNVAIKLIHSKVFSEKGPIDMKKKAKIYRFLLSKGINDEIAEELINDI